MNHEENAARNAALSRARDEQEYDRIKAEFDNNLIGTPEHRAACAIAAQKARLASYNPNLPDATIVVLERVAAALEG